ncbi:MAG: hypothetical protein PHN26_08220, partial [Eubacteriaceae bacterium]|nr:hypothetical protein [Eubacteriaceae bacterium]
MIGGQTMNARNHTIKKGLTVWLLAVVFVVAWNAVAGSNVFAATEAESALISRITAITTEKTSDSDWVKYLKQGFASTTGITSASTSLSWYDTDALVAAGTCDRWDGSVFDPTAGNVLTDTTTVPGTTDYYLDTNSNGTIDAGDERVLKFVDKSDNTQDEYHVYTAEALAYVDEQVFYASTGKQGNCYLEKDMDLNGKTCVWRAGYWIKKQGMDGQNYTIYNLRADAANTMNSPRVGFIAATDGKATFQNLKFQTGYLCGDGSEKEARTALIAYSGKTEKKTLTNVAADNLIVVGGYNTAGLVGRTDTAGVNLSDCQVTNSTVYGAKDHIASLTGTLIDSTVDRCYSTGCTVFSAGMHSGGLISCMNNTAVSNCFTDINLYGSNQTGAFIGAANSGICSFTNCFASGFIEGTDKIGGFAGSLSDSTGEVIKVIDCYTTALVGLRKGGTNMGGFTGYSAGSTINYTNCYAAGEVGAADTDVTAVNGAQANGIGGFFGNTASGMSNFNNCYYDKQTTAMREIAIGTAVTGNYSGMPVGVLTSDTTKSGTGLTSTPGATGFTGFSDSGWDTSDTDHYPELTAFADNTAGFSEADAEVARQYSKTSTSTVLLETWDKGLTEATGKLDNGSSTASAVTTYDTVRDLTIKFDTTGDCSTAGGYSWYRTATQNGKEGTDANANGAKVTINGTEYDVLKLAVNGTTAYADQFHPGLEWLKVDYGNASRRLRVTPTVGIEAGMGQTLFRPSTKAPDAIKKLAFYDHADDVELYYSTAARLAADANDITTGMYPDINGTGEYTSDTSGITGRDENALTQNQLNLMISVNTAAAITTYFGTTAATNNLFGEIASGGNLSYPGIDASYMSRK